MSTIILGRILVLFHLPLPPCGRLGLATGLRMYRNRHDLFPESEKPTSHFWRDQIVSEDVKSLFPRQNSQKGFCLLDRMSQSEHLSFVVSDVKLLMTLHLTKNQEKGRMSCNSSLFHNIKPAMAASSSSSGRSLPRALDLT